MDFIKIPLTGILILFLSLTLSAQQQYELNSGWKAMRATDVKQSGENISLTSYPLTSWLPATVPGTVLTTQLANHLIPDPFYGMNNKQIPDIYNTGRDYYTYWFVKDFTETAENNDIVWAIFRGVNNSADIYLNGHKINDRQYKSMYLRQRYDLTPYLAKDGHNRLAVIVYPPYPVGNPNGGQGGDGTIAHNITAQYTAGWDWTQPIHDRNTGIWDKVFIQKTKQVLVENTHVITLVPGIREVEGKQPPATLQVSSEVENTSDKEITGTLRYKLNKETISTSVTIAPHTRQTVQLPNLRVMNPMLWWPNGYGPQNLYNIKVSFLINGKTISSEEQVIFGIRELQAVWNSRTQSRELHVNGQKIFIKGGNRILSDALLRFSDDRYDAEVRYHRDMNLNLIRVWGGGITERPEFYNACDKYGILVMQDFWVSGDCNGRWYDPLKKDDTTTRRNYPDDHKLFIATAADQVRMLRSHPSLAYWCGGNEIAPPSDILTMLKDSIIPKLDGTRFFFDQSNADSMSYNSHDGPYTLQSTNYFWEHRSYPFNSEIGSVGIGDYESLERFIPKENMIVPYYDTNTHKWIADSVWQYHKYSSYDSSIEAYGHPSDVKDFANKAQLVNYDQYRALMEGASSHMWDWYTGIIMWKTQNPWTALVGQMYDVYLDPNAAMYGMSAGAKPLHIMYDPIKKAIRISNHTLQTTGKLHMYLTMYEMDGRSYDLVNSDLVAPANTCNEYANMGNTIDELQKQNNKFFSLRLFDVNSGQLVDDNLYWLPNSEGQYPGLTTMPKAAIQSKALQLSDTTVSLTISLPNQGPIAFFNRISLVDAVTKKRILPVFYNNNYISILPGHQSTITIQYIPQQGVTPMVSIEGWNVEKQYITITKATK